MVMRVKQSGKWLEGEAEVPGENLPHCHFVYHKTNIT
jgi:hypothetical protein